MNSFATMIEAFYKYFAAHRDYLASRQNEIYSSDHALEQAQQAFNRAVDERVQAALAERGKGGTDE